VRLSGTGLILRVMKVSLSDVKITLQDMLR
jgi:hypothetical protein